MAFSDAAFAGALGVKCIPYCLLLHVFMHIQVFCFVNMTQSTELGFFASFYIKNRKNSHYIIGSNKTNKKSSIWFTDNCTNQNLECKRYNLPWHNAVKMSQNGDIFLSCCWEFSP